GPVKGPRRRDIAPTGELAGLPARDAPKSSRVTASLESGRGLQKSSKKSLLFSGAVSNRIRAGFTRPHTQRLFQFEYPNFSIACFSLPRHVANRLPHLVHLERLDDGGDQLHAFVRDFTGKSDRLQRCFHVVLILNVAVSVPP